MRTRRREGFDISRILGALPSIFARDRGVDCPPFTSPEEAMRWFEWRRQSRMLPVLVCGVSIFFVITILNLVDNMLVRKLNGAVGSFWNRQPIPTGRLW